MVQTLKREETISDWKTIQENVFRRWVNEHLKRVGMRVQDLGEAFSDGLKLIALAEVLSIKKIPKYNKSPTLRAHKLENVHIALNFLQSQGIRLVNIDSTDIIDGKIKLIMSLIWTLILHYSNSQIYADQATATSDEAHATATTDEESVEEKGPPKKRLIAWFRNKVPGFPVNNITKGWKDGKRVGALVDSVAPGLCPDWEGWNPQEPVRNAKEAMDLADDWLGVCQLITPQEIVNPNIDEMSLITYLSQFPKAKIKQNAPLRPPKQFVEENGSLKSSKQSITSAEQLEENGSMESSKQSITSAEKLLENGSLKSSKQSVTSAEQVEENDPLKPPRQHLISFQKNEENVPLKPPRQHLMSAKEVEGPTKPARIFSIREDQQDILSTDIEENIVDENCKNIDQLEYNGIGKDMPIKDGNEEVEELKKYVSEQTLILKDQRYEEIEVNLENNNQTYVDTVDQEVFESRVYNEETHALNEDAGYDNQHLNSTTNAQNSSDEQVITNQNAFDFNIGSQDDPNVNTIFECNKQKEGLEKDSHKLENEASKVIIAENKADITHAEVPDDSPLIDEELREILEFNDKIILHCETETNEETKIDQSSCDLEKENYVNSDITMTFNENREQEKTDSTSLENELENKEKNIQNTEIETADLFDNEKETMEEIDINKWNTESESGEIERESRKMILFLVVLLLGSLMGYLSM